MEDDELFRQRIIIVAILLLIIGPIFLYVYLERGAEDFTDWFFNGIIGLMFTGFIFIFIPTQFGNCTINYSINMKSEDITSLTYYDFFFSRQKSMGRL